MEFIYNYKIQNLNLSIYLLMGKIECKYFNLYLKGENLINSVNLEGVQQNVYAREN